MDIYFLWLHGYLDTLDIRFFRYPHFGYPIQVSGYFWILFLNGKKAIKFKSYDFLAFESGVLLGDLSHFIIFLYIGQESNLYSM